MKVVGIDLAWGEKSGDGICLIEATSDLARVSRIDYSHGDEALMSWVEQYIGDAPSMIFVDAPIVCPNRTGSRPVDKKISDEFRGRHAGCYPANSEKCRRPVRVARRLVDAGFMIGWEGENCRRLLIEVYPHPATIRLFGLDRIVKYKKGRVAEKRQEFRRLQALLRDCIKTQFRNLSIPPELDELLQMEWSKPVEDRTDAFLCSLIGYNHHIYQGKRNEVFGDMQTGFILVPSG
jgi:predicted RNase H-like nuclease